MFNLIEQAVEFVVNIDYSTLALKAAVKTVEVGIEIVKWSLQ